PASTAAMGRHRSCPTGIPMRDRLISLSCCLLLSLALPSAAQAASLAQQRLQYDEAKRALAKGDSAPYRRHANSLRDYPLEPYLAYDELTARLKWAKNEEIEKFLVRSEERRVGNDGRSGG